MVDAREIIQSARAGGAKSLSEADSYRLLAAYEIPAAPWRTAGSPAAAAGAAVEIGFPVAVKACAADLAHKTEHGLVRLGLTARTAVRQAAEDILSRGGVKEVLVQRMVGDGREFLAGLIRDTSFGPCVILGLGGVFTEALADSVIRLAPLDRHEADDMMDGLRGKGILGALRGKPEVDRGALADLLIAVGRLGVDIPDVAEVDINPVLIEGGQPVAADALVVLRQVFLYSP